METDFEMAKKHSEEIQATRAQEELIFYERSIDAYDALCFVQKSGNRYEPGLPHLLPYEVNGAILVNKKGIIIQGDFAVNPSNAEMQELGEIMKECGKFYAWLQSQAVDGK